MLFIQELRPSLIATYPRKIMNAGMITLCYFVASHVALTNIFQMIMFE